MPSSNWCFQVLDEHGVGWESDDGVLDDRERAVLAGALNFHSLVRPGCRFQVIVARGPADQFASLTDKQTVGTVWPPDSVAVAKLLVRSDVRPAHVAERDFDREVLVVNLGGSAAAGSDYYNLPGLSGWIRKTLRSRAPVLYDAARQLDTDRVEWGVRRRAVPVNQPVRISDKGAETRTARPRKKAVLFGLHWLQLGGAEKWALETVQIAHELGAMPIVLTDRASPHPWATHPAMRGAIFIPLSHPLLPGHDSRLLRAILDEYDVRIVHVHHCLWLYERLPWLRSVRPGLLILDSLHISEWRNGGYVRISRTMTEVIDRHHVVSPALRHHLVGPSMVPAEKVFMRPLLDLGAPAPAPATSVGGPRRAGETLTIGFIGRLTQQKRPYLFLALAARLRAAGDGSFRFILHGDGDMAEETRAQIRRHGLGDIVTERSADFPVAATYAECDVIVIPSDNEGLTLTSFEAAQARCLVLSTDVGSQASVVADDLLVPRHPLAFLGRAKRLLLQLRDDTAWFQSLLQEQQQKIDELAKTQGGRAWVAETYAEALI